MSIGNPKGLPCWLVGVEQLGKWISFKWPLKSPLKKDHENEGWDQQSHSHSSQEFESNEIYTMCDYKTTMVLSCSTQWVINQSPKPFDFRRAHGTKLGAHSHVLARNHWVLWLWPSVSRFEVIIPITKRVSIRLITRRGIKEACFKGRYLRNSVVFKRSLTDLLFCHAGNPRRDDFSRHTW